jgi:formiminoglutamase
LIQPWLKEVSKDLFFTKNDSADPRLGDLVQVPWDNSEFNKNSICIVGYPDDEGIRLNGGRPGAALGPGAIRKALYKMTPSLSEPRNPVKLFDCGDVDLSKNSLEHRHENARKTVSSLLKKESRVITLGGGHDYGYPDMAAFCEYVIEQNSRPVVVNFDAHLDVRPVDKRGLNSGTPFYRLLSEFEGKVDFFEVGIQDWCNSREHLKWAKSKGAEILTLGEINSSGTTLGEVLQRRIFSKLNRNHRLALSVDIDGFTSAAAPGASQVFPVGLDAQQFLTVWQALHVQHRPQLASIYEVSPPFDPDESTARLAAILTHQMIFS